MKPKLWYIPKTEKRKELATTMEQVESTKGNNG
jgi:hypothetical protein